MAQEKQQKAETVKFQVPTRTPKKAGIFDNIGANREKGEHPFREIANFPAAQRDAHHENEEASTAFEGGRPPLSVDDAHRDINLTPTDKGMRRPPIANGDAHQNLQRTPTVDISGRPPQTGDGVHRDFDATPTIDETGRHTDEKVGAKAPKHEKLAPTNDSNSGALAPTTEKGGATKDGRRGDRHANQTTERLALRPNGEILKKVKHFCVEQGFSLTEFFELASLKFIDLGAHQGELSGAKAPLNNERLMKMFKTRLTIINLYLAYTARFNEFGPQETKWAGKWLPRDDEAANRFNDIDIGLIEVGIMQTQSNKGIGNGKIQAFSYYVGEIEAAIASGLKDKTLEIMVKHHRSTLDRWFGRELDLSFLETAE